MSKYYEREDVIEQIILNLPFAYEEAESIPKIAERIADSCTPVELKEAPADREIYADIENKTAPEIVPETEPVVIEKDLSNTEQNTEPENESCEDIAGEEDKTIEMTIIEEPAVIENADNAMSQADLTVETLQPKEENAADNGYTGSLADNETHKTAKKKKPTAYAALDDDIPIRGTLFPVFDEDGRYCADKCSYCRKIYPLPHKEMNFCSECGADFRKREDRERDFRLFGSLSGHKWIE